MLKVSSLLCALFLILLPSVPAQGQTLEPRLYSNVPVDMNFLLAGYVYSTGATIADPTVQLENGQIVIQMPFAACARSFGLWGKSAKFDVVVPYGVLSGSATLNGVLKEREVEGFTDPSFRVSMNFAGAPALTLPEFRGYKQDLIFGGSLQILAPLGQYDSTRIVNLGANRWTIKPELGISKALGPVILELSAAAAIFTDNNDFNNGHVKSQEPIYSFQGHIVYTFRKGIWAALDATWFTGGQSTTDGVEGKDLQNNSRLGATLAVPVSKLNSIKLYASTGISTRTGTDFNTYGMAWQYRWGGGL